ncbi:DUF6868 family protein [Govanella unica]|uniref:DUF6868 domain-containing protein n=1 Tax=Govanella unica TaxID=2975056 RepID=A0A9X3Z7D6_9PROT|nr:hypothetical protein [Govania unica]MDA5194042.1 hypothetical protein [Govania unica]
MTLPELSHFLLCCTILNYVILVLWFLVFLCVHDGLERLHSRWFQMTRGQFDAIHYGAMAVYKIGILLLNLVPYVVLQLMPWR